MRRTRIIRVRMDEELYNFIESQRRNAGFNGLSETVRFMLQIVRFLTSTRLMPHDPDTLLKWVNFLKEEGVTKKF